MINAISKSQSQAKAQKALRLLRRMDKLYQSGYKRARPNEFTYTSVLNSCAFPETLDPRTRRKALDTAIFTLQELQASRYGQPNEVTYGTFMQACANLLLPDDDDMLLREVIEATFEQCCKDGQVGEMFLTHLKSAAPEDLYRELLAEVVVTSSSSASTSTSSSRSSNTVSTATDKDADDDLVIHVENLPLEWRCNIRSEHRRNKNKKDYRRKSTKDSIGLKKTERSFKSNLKP